VPVGFPADANPSLPEASPGLEARARLPLAPGRREAACAPIRRRRPIPRPRAIEEPILTTTTTTTPLPIDPSMTMEEVLARAPAAQRALFQRYHIGGCSACGFQPTDTLAQVCKDHNILDVPEVLRTIRIAQEMDTNMQVEPSQVQAWQQSGEDFSLIDVRTPEEWETRRLPGAELLDYNDSGRYMELPKERRIVFACQTGQRSLDVAAYFKGHGFTQVYSLRGGIQGWFENPDPNLPRT
jgi:rhodanese-related sulfurtransferase